MERMREMKMIARVRSDYREKFGIPRQSGLAGTRAAIVFEEEYRNPDAFRGLEEFSHLWILWEFSEAVRETWSPTVRPPRLGGNKRMGVFATRSPFRPNPIGLSCVRLERVDLHGPEGPTLHISGEDMLDGTPVYDIKPYIPYADSHPEARGGFTERVERVKLSVEIPDDLAGRIPEGKREALCDVLSLDPRPAYQSDPDRVYGMAFGELEIRFTVADSVLTVCGAERADARNKLPGKGEEC